eukprot:5254023-Lingulodinium_polyedra.AAC.1
MALFEEQDRFVHALVFLLGSGAAVLRTPVYACLRPRTGRIGRPLLQILFVGWARNESVVGPALCLPHR